MACPRSPVAVPAVTEPASGQARAAERRAERTAPDDDGPAVHPGALRDLVLLIAAIALERTQVDVALGSAVGRVAAHEADAEIGTRRGGERREREEPAPVGQPHHRGPPAGRVLVRA